MKKAAAILLGIVLLVSGTAFAAERVVYSDEQLGFSVEMPRILSIMATMRFWEGA